MTTETIKPKLSHEELKEYAERYLEVLNAGGKILVTITYTSKSNLSYRYTVDIWGQVNGETVRIPASWFLGAFYKETLRAEFRDELRGNGCGFSRTLHAASNLCWAIKQLTGQEINAQHPRRLYLEA